MKRNILRKSPQISAKNSIRIKVSFEDKEQFYFLNIVGVIKSVSEEIGFLILDQFKINEADEATFFKDRLY